MATAVETGSIGSPQPFTFGNFVLLVDRLYEHVEEAKMQRVTYEQAAKDLEQTRAQQTKELLHQSVDLKVKDETPDYISQLEEFDKKQQQLLAEKEQLELKIDLLTQENEALREDLLISNKEKVFAQSKTSEVEAKLSIHCKGKESCLKKIEDVQCKFAELSKSNYILGTLISSLENRLRDAKQVQDKLKILNRHSSCIIDDLQNQIKDKNTTIVRLKADQLKEPIKSASNLSMVTTEEDKLLISSLKEKIVNKTDEIEKLNKLVTTTKTSERELSQVFLIEKGQNSQKIAELESQNQKLQSEADILRCCVIEKEKENSDIEEKFRESYKEAIDLVEEVSVLKSMILSNDTITLDATTQVGVDTKENESQLSFDTFQDKKEFTDKMIECRFNSENQETQTENFSLIFSSPNSRKTKSKRSRSISPLINESTKRGKGERDEKSFEVFEDSTQGPLSPMQRLSLRSVLSPIPFMQDLLDKNSNINDSFDNNDHKEIYQNDKNETPKDPLILYSAIKNNEIPDSIEHTQVLLKEPCTPEHLINIETDRTADYHNDPDYSSVDSDSQHSDKGFLILDETKQVNEPNHSYVSYRRPITVTPEILSHRSEHETVVKESPIVLFGVADDSGLGDEFISSTVTNDATDNFTATSDLVKHPESVTSSELFKARSPICNQKLVLSTMAASSSGSEEDSVFEESDGDAVTPAVTRVLDSAYEQVNSILKQSGKRSFYKASLSKSPRMSTRRRLVSPPPKHVFPTTKPSPPHIPSIPTERKDAALESKTMDIITYAKTLIRSVNNERKSS